MDKGERSFLESSQDTWNLGGELVHERTISWRKCGPPHKNGQVSFNLVGAHILMEGQTSSFLQCRGVPEVSMNFGYGADG